MTSTNPLVLRVGSPRALIESIPHLLGFVPASSLVFVLLRSGPTSRRDRVVLTVRFDLPLDEATDAADIVRATTTAISSSGATAATVVAFGPIPADGGEVIDLESFTLRARSALTACEQALHHQGLRIADVLVVSDMRFRSLLCTDESCCPQGGSPLSDAWSSEVAARVAFAGKPMPARARDELERAVRADPDRIRLVAASLTSSVVLSRTRPEAEPDSASDAAQIADALHRLARTIVRFDESGDIASVDAAAMAWGLVTGRVRDHAVRWIIDAGADEATVDHRAFWECMARSLPSPFDAPAAALAALAAAMDGDGAAVNIALERACAALAEPDHGDVARVFHSLVTNLALVLRAGWAPDQVVAVLATVYRNFEPVTCPRGVES